MISTRFALTRSIGKLRQTWHDPFQSILRHAELEVSQVQSAVLWKLIVATDENDDPALA